MLPRVQNHRRPNKNDLQDKNERKCNTFSLLTPLTVLRYSSSFILMFLGVM